MNNQSELYQAATDYSLEGFIVIPLKADKSPATAAGDYLYKQVAIDDRFNTCAKIGLACGAVSGGLEVIDFDCHDGQPIADVFADFISDTAVSIVIDSYNLPIFETPSGGRHIFFRSDYSNGSQKLAAWGDGSTMIETRGAGGYVAVYPSPGYSHISGSDLLEVSRIDEQAREALLSTARTFTRQPVKSRDKQPARMWPERFNDTTLVGHFNNNGKPLLYEALEAEGWQFSKTRRDGVDIWVRPGKNPERSISATFGTMFNMWYVFSSSQTTFEPERGYTPFDAIRLLKFGGDFDKTIKYAAKLFPNTPAPASDNEIVKHITHEAEVPPFPLDVFPETIRELIMELHRTQTFSIDLLAAATMYTFAAVAGNKFKLMVNNTWLSPCIFWIAAMGKTGTKKSHPVQVMIKPLNEINKVSFKDYEEHHRNWKLSESKEDEPQPRQIYMDDYTLEALLRAHNKNKRGIAVFKDELRGFFGDMNKYRSKGSDEEFWLSSFNNGSYQVNRVSVKPMRIDNLCINLIGTIQPDVMAEIARGTNNNGMIERFLFTNPVTEHEYFSLEDINSAALVAYRQTIMEAFRRFDYTDEVDEIHLKLTPEAKQLMKRIDDRLTDIKRSGDEADRIIGYCSKLQTYSPRFALLSWVLRFIFDGADYTIDRQDFDNASKLVGYFLRTAKRVYFDAEDKAEAKEISTKLTGKAKGEKVTEMLNKGMSPTLIAETLGISRKTVYNIKQASSNV